MGGYTNLMMNERWMECMMPWRIVDHDGKRTDTKRGLLVVLDVLLRGYSLVTLVILTSR
jgi:hypothetical protein